MRTPTLVSRRTWLVLGLVLVTVCGAGFTWAGRTPGVRWWLVNNWVRLRFSEVHTLSTSELSASLMGAPENRPLLLDVREPGEYAVSHLPGARRFPPDADGTALTDWPKNAPVVTYCSVGYRSAVLARRLQAAGFTDVRNLRGSVFAWANEGRPLLDAQGRKTTVVHPYDRTWGLLVKPGARWPGKTNAVD